jgi:cardiolipin synthase
VVADERFANALRTSLQSAMDAGARQIRPETWRRRPLLERVADWACYGFARLLTGVSAYGQAREFV